WLSWSVCTSSCGGGSQFRIYICNKAHEYACNRTLTSSLGYSLRCNQQCCQATSTWLPWQQWTACSATLGQGTRRRERTCTGKECDGDALMHALCVATTLTPTQSRLPYSYEIIMHLNFR
ncbi:hypothetical protein CAPTEDRAFT_126521, partial [Capitella teleta]